MNTPNETTLKAMQEPLSNEEFDSVDDIFTAAMKEQSFGYQIVGACINKYPLLPNEEPEFKTFKDAKEILISDFAERIMNLEKTLNRIREMTEDDL